MTSGWTAYIFEGIPEGQNETTAWWPWTYMLTSKEFGKSVTGIWCLGCHPYIFMLVCCYQSECHHALCKKGRPVSPPTCYHGGPPVTELPPPKVDPHRQCELVDVTDKRALSSITLPPSSILKNSLKPSPLMPSVMTVRVPYKRLLKWCCYHLMTQEYGSNVWILSQIWSCKGMSKKKGLLGKFQRLDCFWGILLWRMCVPRRGRWR